MGQFEHRNNGNSDVIVTALQRHGFEQLPDIFALAFGGDGGRREFVHFLHRLKSVPPWLPAWHRL